MLWSGMVIRVGTLVSHDYTDSARRPALEDAACQGPRKELQQHKGTSREGEAFLMLSWGNMWFRDTGATCPAEDSTSPGKL